MNTALKQTSARSFTAGALCDYLTKAGQLTSADAARVQRLYEDQAGQESIVPLIIKLGLLSDREVARSVAAMTGLTLIEKKQYPDEMVADSAISLKFLKENNLFVLDEDNESLVIATVDPSNDYVFSALGLITEKQIEVRIGVLSDIEESLDQLTNLSKEQHDKASLSALHEGVLKDDVEQLKELASEAPVIKRVNQIIQKAVTTGASDIHIEPFENRLQVRYRIDGMLRDQEAPPMQEAAAVVSRIKILANLNIAERRLPQDGRFKVRVQGNKIDLRVSTIPTLYGESVVMRLLRRDDFAYDFKHLGMDEQLTEKILDVLSKPHGIVLVTGPTGSGKTTTLYAALKFLNRPELKIITVEDPVEYNIDGINQIHVKAEIGLTFSHALRSIVRQDPDVIMIGEMRDTETAKIAVQSALTGHLVLSTLHTNDAASSITRLQDMGVESYLISSTVNAVMAQRLVRKLCTHCREPYVPAEEDLIAWKLRDQFHGRAKTLYQAGGCEHCEHSGYAGRVAIVELLTLSNPIKRLIVEQADAETLTHQARADGMMSMFEDGMKKVIEGMTTVEEILRLTQEG